MKRLFFILLLLAGVQRSLAQGTPKYMVDIYSLDPTGSYSGFLGAWSHATNAIQSIYRHTDFPTMPLQGFITDVFVRGSYLTPAGYTIPGLQIELGRTNLRNYPFLQVWDQQFYCSLIDTMISTLKTVYYDSLYTLKINWGTGQWLKFHLQTPYQYTMQPLPNDTQQNLVVQLSQKWDYGYVPHTYYCNLDAVACDKYDSLRFATIAFFMDSMKHVIQNTSMYSWSCLPIIGFSGYSLSVNDPNKIKPFTVFPNPAQSTLHFSEQPSGRFMMYDISGKTVLQGNTDSNGEIDIKTLSSGAYLLKIGEQTIRFLKE